MKILILMVYYERPTLVRNALNSILKASKYHQDWHLAFFDDGSQTPGQPIVEEMLKDHLDKITFYNSHMTPEEKEIEGCKVGHYLNKMSLENPGDILIVLCDDDELYPEYLMNLSKFFTENPKETSCYSKIHLYNPMLEKSENVDNLIGHYNQWTGYIRPDCRVEGSQVAWRREAVDKGVRWQESCTGNHDVYFLQDLFEKTGVTAESGFIAAYKGCHSKQLGRRAFDLDAKWKLNDDAAYRGETEGSLEDEMAIMIEDAVNRATKWAEQGMVNESYGVLIQLLKIAEPLIKEEYPEVYFMAGMLGKDKELLELAALHAENESDRKHALEAIDYIAMDR